MNQRRLAWTIWGVSLAFAVGAVIVDRLAGGADIGESIFVLLAVLLYATVGALITSRQAGNRVGLLFAWVGLSASISLLAGSYATLAQREICPSSRRPRGSAGSGSRRCSGRSPSSS